MLPPVSKQCVVGSCEIHYRPPPVRIMLSTTCIPLRPKMLLSSRCCDIGRLRIHYYVATEREANERENQYPVVHRCGCSVGSSRCAPSRRASRAYQHSSRQAVDFFCLSLHCREYVDGFLAVTCCGGPSLNVSQDRKKYRNLHSRPRGTPHSQPTPYVLERRVGCCLVCVRCEVKVEGQTLHAVSGCYLYGTYFYPQPARTPLPGTYCCKLGYRSVRWAPTVRS